MMVDEINICGDLGFRAYVIHPSDAPTTDLWVCLRSQQSVARRGWLGCWSLAGSDITPDRLRQFVANLADIVERNGCTGPMGPFLDGHHFFEGWKTWGMGVPDPLHGIGVDEVISGVTAHYDIDSYVHGGPGI